MYNPHSRTNIAVYRGDTLPKNKTNSAWLILALCYFYPYVSCVSDLLSHLQPAKVGEESNNDMTEQIRLHQVDEAGTEQDVKR